MDLENFNFRGASSPIHFFECMQSCLALLSRCYVFVLQTLKFFICINSPDTFLFTIRTRPSHHCHRFCRHPDKFTFRPLPFPLGTFRCCINSSPVCVPFSSETASLFPLVRVSPHPARWTIDEGHAFPCDRKSVMQFCVDILLFYPRARLEWKHVTKSLSF